MPAPEIEDFARKLVQHVRDAAIKSSDQDMRPVAGSPVAKRWREFLSHEGGALASVMIPDVVDDTIFYLLQAIDEGALQLSFTASNGKVVDLPAEGHGELAGWYMGSGGWRTQYSQQRLIDDFSDLR